MNSTLVGSAGKRAKKFGFQTLIETPSPLILPNSTYWGCNATLVLIQSYKWTYASRHQKLGIILETKVFQKQYFK